MNCGISSFATLVFILGTHALAVSPDSATRELMKDVPVTTAFEAAIVKPSRGMWMEVTAYCACPKCCGPRANGITASGKPVTWNIGRFVAADTSVLPFGSRIRIPGYYDGQAVPVIDRGGAIKGNHLDVFFPVHRQALEWGRRWVWVEVE